MSASIIRQGWTYGVVDRVGGYRHPDYPGYRVYGYDHIWNVSYPDHRTNTQHKTMTRACAHVTLQAVSA